MQEKINKILWGCVILGTILLLFCHLFQTIKMKDSFYSETFFAMDTNIYIKLYTQNEKKAKKSIQKAKEIYRYYEGLTNRNEVDQTLHNLAYIHKNKSKEEYITIEKELYQMIELGLSWYQKSNHLIDISKGNLYDTWKKHFDRDIPSKGELKKADTDQIESIILKGENQIKNNHVNLLLDSFQIGYANDKVKEYLEREGFTSYIINAGGNIVVGKRNKKESFKIALEDPTSSKGKIFTTIQMNQQAVSLSGNYQQHYEYKGKQYALLIHPKTRFPMKDKYGVFVISNTSCDASIYSAMLFQMELNQGKEFVEKEKSLAANWIIYSKESMESSNWKNYLYENGKNN